MPELPEVEVTRLSFASKITGARIASAQLGKPLRWPLGVPVQQLVGHYVVSVRRRGKYLLLDLDDGLLLIHLGMSGSLSFSDSLPPLGLHDHFELVTNQGTLRLHDPRRFGAVVFAPSEGSPVALKLLGKLGVEPLSEAFEPRTFHAGLKRRHAAIKQVLLAGDVVVGVGNIYANESLFRAGIRPTRPANKVSRERLARLVDAVRADESHLIVDACHSYFLAYGRGPGGTRREIHGFAPAGKNEPRLRQAASLSRGDPCFCCIPSRISWQVSGARPRVPCRRSPSRGESRPSRT